MSSPTPTYMLICSNLYERKWEHAKLLSPSFWGYLAHFNTLWERKYNTELFIKNKNQLPPFFAFHWFCSLSPMSRVNLLMAGTFIQHRTLIKVQPCN